MLWILYSLLSAFSDATKDFLSKRVLRGRSFDAIVPAWAALAFASPFFAILMLFSGRTEVGPLFLPAAAVNAGLFVLANVCYMRGIKLSDLSLTLPMIAFTPAFMLITGLLVLGEMPAPLGMAGVLVVALGAYLLRSGKGLLAPIRSLFADPGAKYLLAVALIYSLTAVSLKLAITASSPMFAITVIYLLALVLLTAYGLWTRRFDDVRLADLPALVPIGLVTVLSEMGLVYAFTLTLAVYAIAVKRLSIIIGSVYGFVFFGERDALRRIAASLIMLVGVVLLALS